MKIHHGQLGGAGAPSSAEGEQVSLLVQQRDALKFQNQNQNQHGARGLRSEGSPRAICEQVPELPPQVLTTWRPGAGGQPGEVGGRPPTSSQRIPERLRVRF